MLSLRFTALISLKTDDNKMFRQNISSKSTPKSNINKLVKRAESNKEFDIIFIQEPPWSIIWSIPSSLSKEGL